MPSPPSISASSASFSERCFLVLGCLLACVGSGPGAIALSLCLSSGEDSRNCFLVLGCLLACVGSGPGAIALSLCLSSGEDSRNPLSSARPSLCRFGALSVTASTGESLVPLASDSLSESVCNPARFRRSSASASAARQRMLDGI